MADSPTLSPTEQAEQLLIRELRQLYLEAGEPSLRKIAQATKYSPSTIHSALREERVPTLPVVEAIVSFLNGDVNRFRMLHELIRAEELGLEDRALDIYDTLDLSSTSRKPSIETVVNHFYGNVTTANADFAKGGRPQFRPLFDALPANIREVYETACDSFNKGSYGSVIVLCRWLVNAVILSKVDPERLTAGRQLTFQDSLELMADSGQLDDRMERWLRDAYRQSNSFAHQRVEGNIDLARNALELITAILAYHYVVKVVS